MIPSMKISGLYAITPDHADTGLLVRQVRAVLAGGAQALQYRNTIADARTRLEQAGALRTLCQTYAALFIINDDIALAARVGADGAHLGKHDASMKNARAALGAGKIIGVSCYDNLGRARNAAAQGADYIAFGSFFPSPTKPAAVRPGLDLLQEARRQLTLPLVAIGGIDLHNAPMAIAAGADAVAVISALFTATDIEAAARGFCGLFASKNYDFA